MIIQHFYPIFQSNLDTYTLPQHCMSSSTYFILNTLIKKKTHFPSSVVRLIILSLISRVMEWH